VIPLSNTQDGKAALKSAAFFIFGVIATKAFVRVVFKSISSLDFLVPSANHPRDARFAGLDLSKTAGALLRLNRPA